ncbi:hypothetical protein [Parasphingorhabdus flavimaris]|uniref:hypothetical protein n=1 Tax=Parasphingorhabdus flavimaris TaxID=266812 RepID=UPI00300251B6
MNQQKLKDHILEIISPIKEVDQGTQANKNFLFNAKRTDAGRSLPPYYLVYFLFVDLLNFRNLGQFEKIAWSVPIEYEGKAFLIEHRKFGLGIFAADLATDETQAEEIAQRIRDAVMAAQPYFDDLADQAAGSDALNVVNHAPELFERHRYYLDQYQSRRDEAERRKDERIKTESKTESGLNAIISFPAVSIRREAKWLALSSIETFFSWTEHVFILIGILKGKLPTGRDVKRLANANWYQKFETALDISDQVTKDFYDELKIIRQQLRNFDAHGSFGKNREAFQFHSSVGAVPLRLPYQIGDDELKFGHGVEFVEHEAIETIIKFTEHLWQGDNEPAYTYIQDYGLVLILSYVSNGNYADAMQNDKLMIEFCDFLAQTMDRYANMDF